MCNLEVGGTCDHSGALQVSQTRCCPTSSIFAYAVILPGISLYGCPAPHDLSKPTCCLTFSVSIMPSKAASSSKSTQIDPKWNPLKGLPEHILCLSPFSFLFVYSFRKYLRNACQVSSTGDPGRNGPHSPVGEEGMKQMHVQLQL